MTIIQERSLSFLLIARKLSQAVGGGARHVQLADAAKASCHE